MDHINISDFQISSSVSGTYCVSNLEAKKARNNNTYLKAILSDASGSIDMVCWEYEDATITQRPELISVVGSVGNYYGRPQFIAQSYRFPAEQEYKALDLAPLIPAAPICVETYIECINSLISSLSDKSLLFICMDVFDQYWDDFVIIPAAQTKHHAFLHGLLMHTVDTASLAGDAAQKRRGVNRDLLLAGALLHDIGKIHEFERSPYTGLVSGYTERGRLHGHAAIGFQMIEDAAKNVKADPHIAALLQHLVLAHHGDIPFRFPNQTPLVELELLRRLDSADSCCENILESSRRANTGSFAESALPTRPDNGNSDQETVDF